MSEQQDGNNVKPGNGGRGAKGARAQAAAGEAGQQQPVAGAAAGEGEQRQEPVQQAQPQPGGRGVKAGWGRYLVAPRSLGLLPGGVPPIEASALFGPVQVIDPCWPSPWRSPSCSAPCRSYRLGRRAVHGADPDSYQTHRPTGHERSSSGRPDSGGPLWVGFLTVRQAGAVPPRVRKPRCPRVGGSR